MAFVQGSDKLRGIDLSFEPNPNTGDIPTVSRFSVIRQSLENLLTFNPLEKPFREDMGSELNQILFNVVSLSDIPPIKSRIENILERLEPRIRVVAVTIDSNLDDNELTVNIEYVIKQTEERDRFSTILRVSE